MLQIPIELSNLIKFLALQKYQKIHRATRSKVAMLMGYYKRKWMEDLVDTRNRRLCKCCKFHQSKSSSMKEDNLNQPKTKYPKIIHKKVQMTLLIQVMCNRTR